MFVLALARSCRLFLDCNHDQNAISYELVFQGTQETRYDRGEYSDKFQNGRMWFEDRHTDWGAVQRSAGFYKYEPHEFVSVLRLVMMIYEKAKFGSSPGYRFGTGESFTVLLNFQLCISKVLHSPTNLTSYWNANILRTLRQFLVALKFSISSRVLTEHIDGPQTLLFISDLNEAAAEIRISNK